MMIVLGVPSSKVRASETGIVRQKFRVFLAEVASPRSMWGDAMPDATIHTIGRVLEHPGAVLYRVSLPNGKVILAHLSKPLADAGAVFAVNDEVRLELSPYDFDTARILCLAV